MSSGKTLNQIEIKTPEEQASELALLEGRVIGLEMRVPVLIQRIQAYDQLIEDLKAIKIAFSDMSKAQNIHNDSTKKFIEFFNEFKAQNDFKHKNSHEQKVELENKLDKHSRDIENLKSVIEANRCGLMDVKNLSENLQNQIKSNCLSREQFDRHKLENSLNIGNLIDEKNTISNKLSEHIDKSKTILEQNERRFQEIFSLKKESEFFEESLKDLKSLISRTKSEMVDLIDKESKSKMSKIESDIQELKKNVDESVNLPSVIKTEINNKIENALLDAGNAVLKASNSAQKIVVLEKKIENLYLLVNKLELNKGTL